MGEGSIHKQKRFSLHTIGIKYSQRQALIQTIYVHCQIYSVPRHQKLSAAPDISELSAAKWLILHKDHKPSLPCTLPIFDINSDLSGNLMSLIVSRPWTALCCDVD